LAVASLVLAAAPSLAASPCFTVRGRLEIWNGTPSVRIWPVGTRRMLGVVTASGSPDGGPLMPPPVQALIDQAPDQGAVYGDYRVCPLTRDQPGRMRAVYILGATRLRAERR